MIIKNNNPIKRRLTAPYDSTIESQMYDEKFYEDNKSWYEKGIPYFVDYLLNNFEFSSIVDVGCGTGAFIKPLEKIKKILGIDFSIGSTNTLLNKNNFIIKDLTKPLNLNMEFDIVLSLEVYEHIPKQFEEQYVINLLSFKPKYLIISCAIPFPRQIGRRHYNCNTPEYIIEKFKNYNYIVNNDLTDKFKNIKYLASFYRKNTLIFENIK